MGRVRKEVEIWNVQYPSIKSEGVLKKNKSPVDGTIKSINHFSFHTIPQFTNVCFSLVKNLFRGKIFDFGWVNTYKITDRELISIEITWN